MHVLAHRPALPYATPHARTKPTHHAETALRSATNAQPDSHIAGIECRQCAVLSTRFDHGWLYETPVGGTTGGSSPDRIVSSN